MNRMPADNRLSPNFVLKLIMVTLLPATITACSGATYNGNSDVTPPYIKASTETKEPDSTLNSSRMAHRRDGTRPTPSQASTPETSPSLDIWSELANQSEFIDHLAHPNIAQYVSHYADDPTYFKTVLQRAPLYMPVILRKLKAKDLPAELVLLPFIESSYSPFAYSMSGAAGLWQFIPATGDHMGLERSWWYDGRRDVLASTDAALDYLAYLNKRFNGDWLVTLAAYNGGEGTVSRAIRKNRVAGKGVDFWSLDLFSETKAYVPRFLALVKIMGQAERYNVELPEMTNTVRYKSITLDSQIDLQQAARFAGIDIDTLYKLNPGYRRWSTPPAGPHRLLLPVDTIAVFEKALAATPRENWRPVQAYVVKSGDTLSEIASRHHLPVNEIISVNNLSSDLIVADQILKLPALTSANRARLPSYLNKATRYLVRRGDTLWKIAKTHRVSIKQLRRWNGISLSQILRPGQKLMLYPGS